MSCETDDDTTYTAGDGLELSDTTFEIRQDCADGQLVKFNGSTWVCTNDAVSGGDAETLDSLDSTQFLRSDVDDRFESSLLALDGDLDIGQASASDDDRISFDGSGTGAEWLEWDESLDRFALSNELAMVGPIETGGSLADDVSYNRFGPGVSELGLSGNSDVLVSDDMEVNDTLFVNGPSIYLNADGPEEDAQLCAFRGSARCGEEVEWDSSIDAWDFSDDVQLDFEEEAATTTGVCHSGSDADSSGAFSRFLVPCSGAPGDVAEWYETTGAEAGDIVVPTDETLTFESDKVDPRTGMIEEDEKETLTASVLAPATGDDRARAIGVVSSSPAKTIGRAVIDAADHPAPVAVAGRVPVKVTAENGDIRPGVGQKATESGRVIGYALDHHRTDEVGKILVFVDPGWYGGDDANPEDADGTSRVDELESRLDELERDVRGDDDPETSGARTAGAHAPSTLQILAWIGLAAAGAGAAGGFVGWRLARGDGSADGEDRDEA